MKDIIEKLSDKQLQYYVDKHKERADNMQKHIDSIPGSIKRYQEQIDAADRVTQELKVGIELELTSAEMYKAELNRRGVKLDEQPEQSS